MSHRSITYHQHNENKRYRNIDNSAKHWKEDIIADSEFNVLSLSALSVGCQGAEESHPERTPVKSKPVDQREAPVLVHSPSLDDLQRQDAVTFVIDDVDKLSIDDESDNDGKDTRRASSVISSDTSVSTSSSASSTSIEITRHTNSPKRITFRRSTGDIRQPGACGRMTEHFFNDVDFRLHSFKSTKAGMTQVWYNSLLNRTSKIDMRSKYGVFMLTRM